MAGGEAASSGGSSSFLDQLKSAKASTGPCTVEEAKSRGVWGGRPDSDYSSNAQGKTNINACSRPRPFHMPGEARNVGQYKVPITPEDPICVDGKPYIDPDKIPGNEPTALLDGKGKIVNGPSVNGAETGPVYGPARGIDNMDNVKSGLENPVSRSDSKHKLETSGEWDYQRIHDDDGSIIFMKKYRDFANVLIGYGEGQKKASEDAQTYTSAKNFYRMFQFKPPVFEGETKDPAYPAVPKQLTDDYKIGERLRVDGVSKRKATVP